MNKQEGVAFLFTIAKEIQVSFTSPVIFFTQKDFTANIFTTMRNIHHALQKQEPPEKIAEIVRSFHNEWLEAVLNVEMFSKRVKDTPREVILNALDYTMDCTQLRYNHIQEYIDEMRSTMTEEENQLMKKKLTIIKEMQHTVNSALLEKKRYINSQADQTEYLNRIYDEIEELLHWLDRLEDSIAIELCNVLKVPLAPSNLTTTFKQIIDEVAQDTAPEAQRIAAISHVTVAKGNLLTSSDKLGCVNEQEIASIVDKIKALKARISRLRVEDSPAIMALTHKTMFLEDRLQSLENIKMAMYKLRNESWAQDSDRDENLDEHRPITLTIFSHLLPHKDRCRLVEKLILLWNKALMEKGQDDESIIDILSVAHLPREQYSDEMGTFIVDKFGRKMYTTGDDILYQLNENNFLVPLSDDEKHIYFYDACGRYYLNVTRQRVYKNHDGASEFMLKEGLLVKVREERDGVEYFYDELGRYYVNAEGRHIYRDKDSNDEYERDGLDNLVKIHDKPFYYAPCTSGPITTEENKYLRKEVGDALKKCIAKVVVHQPTDPIAYLADLLTKYSDNTKAHQKHLKDEQERFELSQLIHTTKDNSVNLSYADEATEDINFINYQFETEVSVTSF